MSGKKKEGKREILLDLSMPRYSCALISIILFHLNGLAQPVLESSPLPIVVIHTLGDSIQDDPRITAHLGIISNENGERNWITDAFNEYDGQISIEYRGSSSQSFPKKSYGLETQHPDSSNNNVSLFGMPRENDWILHGPFSDKSLMRNRLIFELARKLSVYAPRTQYCELVINEVYQGVYLWMEKIKRDQNRVDIDRLNPEERDPEEISGGYILKLDKTTGSGGTGWRTPEGTFVQYEYPSAEEINADQIDYIRRYVDEFEQALYGYRFQDFDQGFRAYADALSFVDFILLNELGKNVDGYRLSTFLHKDKGGKLKAGPVWDFNLAFGNANYCGGEVPTEWALNFNRFCPEDFWTINNWWDRMLSDPIFSQLLQDRWHILRQGPWHRDSLDAMLNQFLEELGDAPTRNFQRWDILRAWVWPNAVVLNDYLMEVEYLRNWLHQRARWMDDNLEMISFGVRGPRSISKYFLAPNPFTSYLDINFNSHFNGELRFQLFNLQGREVLHLLLPVEAGYELRHTWDGTEDEGHRIPAGLYTFRFLINGEIVKQGKVVRR